MLDRRLAILSFVLTASLAALSGCANEDYYCDDSACYFCDGVGCREVDPPDRPPCRGDFECSSGFACTTLGCTSFGCTEDADCEMGTVCDANGYCVAPSEPTPEPNPGTCSTNADCDSDLVCLDGLCVLNPGPSACTEAADCAAGEVCLDGSCRPAEDTCQFNTECGPERICVNQTCTTGCESDAQCAEGLACNESGFCVDEEPVSPECMTGADCGPNMLCLDGQCEAQCTTTADCGGGQYCSGGSCVVDDRPRPFCVDDSDCNEGAVCRNGACRSPCAEHAECPRFDVSLTFCLDGLCATTNEFTSDCSSRADCGADQNCIDGVCR